MGAHPFDLGAYALDWPALLRRWQEPEASSARKRPSAPPTAAAQLASWLSWTDAIDLAAVLDAAPSLPIGSRPSSPEPQPPGQGRLEADRAQWRERVSMRTEAFERELRRYSSPGRRFDADFLPYRQHLMALQRDIAHGVHQHRVALRQALVTSGRSRLAAIDTILESSLENPWKAAQTQSVALLKRRHALHLQSDPSTDTAAAPSATARDTVALLEAELDLRWKTLTGLQQALDSL